MGDFWINFEKFVGCEIPPIIKKILKATAYDSVLSLAGMNEEEIKQIEKCIKNRKFNDLFKDSVYAMSEEFEFLPGHRKLLLALGKQAENYELLSSMKFPCESFLMNELINSMKNNRNVASKQHRYSEAIQNFAIYIYLLSGKAAYEVLCSNLPLPQVPTILKYISKNKHTIVEGEIRAKELADYCDKMKVPRKVWLQEDASGIVSTVAYDSSSSQLVGLVLPIDDRTGMPIPFSFAPQSLEQIEQQIKQHEKSTLVYVILAQPLSDNVPPFIVQIYGTDNRFKSQDVLSRWRHTKDQLLRFGIEIVGASSDGDARLLACMKQSLNGLFNQHSHDVLNNLSHEQPISFIQDTIHLGTKLRNRLLKASILLPMGCKQVSIAHLKILLNEVGKDVHGLVWSDISTEDRQNFLSLEKVMHDRVLNALKKYVPDSEATVRYLELCRDITQSFLDVSLSPLERISMIWRSLYFCRAWQTWIKMHDNDTASVKYKIDDNFISDNAFACIEINAYGILHLITKLRDSCEPNLLLISLFSSQGCESLFRQFRSMTTANWTKINFSLNELLHMIGRIELMNEISYFKLPSINLPRISQREKHKIFSLPSNEEIQSEMKRAFESALSEVKKYGMSISPDDIRTCQLRKGTLPCKGAKVQTKTYDEDLNQSHKMDFTHFRNYAGDMDGELNGSSKFIEVIDEGEGTVKYIRKSAIVWNILEGKKKSSNDRLVRVRKNSGNRKSTSTEELISKKTTIRDDLYISSEISVGDWCIFKICGDNSNEYGQPKNIITSIIIGRVLGFKYIKGKSEKEKQYSWDIAPIVSDSSNKRGIEVLAIWNELRSNSTVEALSTPSFFVNIENYVAHFNSLEAFKNPEFKVALLKLL